MRHGHSKLTWLRLNIFYMLLEKLNSFVDGKYDVTVSPAEIVEQYEAKRGDSAQQIEALAITQKFISTCKPLLYPHIFMS